MYLKINGKNHNTNSTTLFSLKNELNYDKDNIITIYNGFQTNEDHVLKEDDEISFIEKGNFPPKDELYALMRARHTPRVFEKVKNASVAIAGLGGLGSNVAINLARTGVGNLHLIDFDIVEPSNLNRQQYKIKDLGLFKTEALKNEIAEINPYINVRIDTIKITEDNVSKLFKDDDIICEAFDNPEAKSMIVNSVLEHFKDKKLVCASGMAGYFSSNLINTKKLGNNLYICGDNTHEAKIGQGLMAPRVSICAGHESNMILRLILGIDEI